MASKELTREVADLLADEFPEPASGLSYEDVANKLCVRFLAALQEPTEGMIKSGQSFYNGTKPFQIKHWSAMLAASALGEQSE
jgi:hypothetical protein